MKTTGKHFELFKATCAEYQQKLGLTDWEFRYAHDDRHADTSLAYSVCQFGARVATLGLTREWGDHTAGPCEIRFVARHEVLHVLLAELDHLAFDRGTTREAWGAAEHAVIRRLEQLV